MPNNNLPTTPFASLLSKSLTDKLSTSQVESLVNNFDGEKSLNWKLLYKTLEASIEEFIFINNGNPTVNRFRDKTINDLTEIVMLLCGHKPDNND